MGSFFGREENKPQAVGGITGWDTSGANLLKLFGQYAANPESLPGGGTLAAYGSGPFAKRAEDIQSGYLDPNFLTSDAPGMDKLFSSWRTQGEADKQRSLAGDVMHYGGLGQNSSSPMLESLGNVARQYDTDLASRIGGTQLDQYNRKLALQSQTALLPLQAASEQGNSLARLLSLYMNMIGIAKPQYQQSTYQPSVWDQLMGLAKAAAPAAATAMLGAPV